MKRKRKNSSAAGDEAPALNGQLPVAAASDAPTSLVVAALAPSEESPSLNPKSRTATMSDKKKKRKKWREADGKFAKGNPGGPGNPFGRQTAALRSALCRVARPEDMTQIAHDLLCQAKVGNLAALRLLLLYTVGRPTVAIDPDRVETLDWERVAETIVSGEAVKSALGGVTADVACKIVRAALPTVVRELAGQLGAAPEQ